MPLIQQQQTWIFIKQLKLFCFSSKKSGCYCIFIITSPCHCKGRGIHTSIEDFTFKIFAVVTYTQILYININIYTWVNGLMCVCIYVYINRGNMYVYIYTHLHISIWCLLSHFLFYTNMPCSASFVMLVVWTRVGLQVRTSFLRLKLGIIRVCRKRDTVCFVMLVLQSPACLTFITGI